jgi:hypothetical protein
MMMGVEARMMMGVEARALPSLRSLLQQDSVSLLQQYPHSSSLWWDKPSPVTMLRFLCILAIELLLVQSKEAEDGEGEAGEGIRCN